MARLVAAFADFLRGGEETLPGAFRTQVGPFLQERGVDFRRRGVAEAFTMQHVEHRLTFGLAERPRLRAAATRLGRGGNLLPAIVAGPAHTQRRTGGAYADRRGQRGHCR